MGCIYNVFIDSRALIFGKVNIGNNSKIGANTVEFTGEVEEA